MSSFLQISNEKEEKRIKFDILNTSRQLVRRKYKAKTEERCRMDQLLLIAPLCHHCLFHVTVREIGSSRKMNKVKICGDV